MIPSAGLDNIAAYAPWTYLTGATSSSNEFLAYAAISEDSAEPLATDTNIGTERARTNSTGGFSRTATVIRDPIASRAGVSIERAYVFDIASSWNITKYGYVPVSSGGNFSWIDLVRSDPNDPESQPITLTLEPGDQLQLWCTFTVTVPWSVDLEPFVITGAPGNDTAGTYDAYCGFYATNDSLTHTSGFAAELISLLFWPTQARGVYAHAAATDTTRDSTTGALTGGAAGSNGTLDAYISGNYYRDKRFRFTTSQANIAMTGITLLSGSSNNAPWGFKIVFDNPATFDKANTHELTLTFRVSWQEG